MTDDEAKAVVAQLLAIEGVKAQHPTWLKVVDLALWAKARLAEGNKPQQPRTKAEQRDHRRVYMRNLMRQKRAKELSNG